MRLNSSRDEEDAPAFLFRPPWKKQGQLMVKVFLFSSFLAFFPTFLCLSLHEKDIFWSSHDKDKQNVYLL